MDSGLEPRVDGTLRPSCGRHRRGGEHLKCLQNAGPGRQRQLPQGVVSVGFLGAPPQGVKGVHPRQAQGQPTPILQGPFRD